MSECKCGGWVDAGELDRGLEMEPQKLPPMHGPIIMADGTVLTPREGVKFDQNKRRVDLVPTEAINALADILTAGAAKYGEHNWRKGMDWSRVYGAAQRHLLAFWGGDDIDEESGMPHLWHALTNIAFLVSYQAMSVGRDDRWKQEGGE